MPPKKNRVSTKEVDAIFKKSDFLVSPSLTFKYIKSKDKEARISFIVPKNIAKLAVTRNFLRRKGYAALEKQLKLSPIQITGVFIFRKYQDHISILENEIKNIFSKFR